MNWGPPCTMSNLQGISLFGCSKVVHKEAVLSFKVAELLSTATKYGRELLRIDNNYKVQTYVCRPIRGSESYSRHAYGIAVDIKPWLNPMRDDGLLYTDFDKFGVKDGYRFVKAWTDAGFRWGGIWSSVASAVLGALRLAQGAKVRSGRTDPMHMELGDSPVPTRKLRKVVAEFKENEPELYALALKKAKARNMDELFAAWKAGRA